MDNGNDNGNKHNVNGKYQFFGDQQAQLRLAVREEKRRVQRGPLRLFLTFLGLFILGLLLPIVMLGILG